jgi:hypothetical protein
MPTLDAFISWCGGALEARRLRHTANRIGKQPTSSLFFFREYANAYLPFIEERKFKYKISPQVRTQED